MLPFKPSRQKARGEKRGRSIGRYATEWKLRGRSTQLREAPKWGFLLQQKSKGLLTLDAKGKSQGVKRTSSALCGDLTEAYYIRDK